MDCCHRKMTRHFYCPPPKREKRVLTDKHPKAPLVNQFKNNINPDKS